MNVTLNWLKEYINFDFSAEELSDRLMMLGIETESITQLGKELGGVVVGRIKSVREHPNANKLVLFDVDVGGNADLQIVCGAPDVRAGLVAAVAPVGVTLPTGLTIREMKIRGQDSRGMLCSEKELAISEEATGLMEVPSDVSVGMPLLEALGLDDVVLELEITPNRPDCLSMIGVAREIRAETGNLLRVPEVAVKESGADIQELTSVTLEESSLCPRYAVRVIRGVKVAPSPKWLRKRLESIGVGTINNVVDITNYVLMERGQPLHAFDYHKLAENRIVVRRAQSGETLKTLDAEERELTSDMLVVADTEKPVALAGVMGGFDSEITVHTVDVILESAYFDPSNIRKTSKVLGMHTEASHRFERGVDFDGNIAAIDRAAQLIAEIAGGDIAVGVIDVYPRPRNPVRIKLRPERVNFVLGTEIHRNEMRDILSRLEFSTSDGFEVIVPTFRPDVEREIDIIEEIARVYGYDNIPITIPKGDIPKPPLDTKSGLRERVKAYLLASGMMEACNYSFCHPNGFDRIRLDCGDPLRQAIKIRNPLSQDMSIMRTTLIPSLLDNAQRNRNYRVEGVQLFEVSKVFIRTVDSQLPNEVERVSAIITGSLGSGFYSDPYRPADFFDIKGVVEGLLDCCGNLDYTMTGTHNPTFHPGRNAEVCVKGQRIGILGEVHPDVLEDYDLPYKAYLFELDFDVLVKVANFTTRVEPISAYPSVNRDLAIVLDADIPSDRPIGIIRSVGADLVKSLRLFDFYIGDQLPDGKKSLAYSIEYASQVETLTDEVVDRVHEQIIGKLGRELGAELRS